MLIDIFAALAIVLVVSALLMIAMTWAITSDKYKQYRIRTPDKPRIPKNKKYANIIFNSTLSLAFFSGAIYLFHGQLVYDGDAKGVTIFGEIVATILFYDFFYYFMHRAMHHPKAMKYVHGVHHYVRYPTSLESIYLHPLENIAGLSLLIASLAIIGPVSFEAFFVIILIHWTLNIIVHSNLVLPSPFFKFFNFLAIKHDIHHGKHLNKNYASLTPFWDLMFGTYA